jgi:hypothetical protein
MRDGGRIVPCAFRVPLCGAVRKTGQQTTRGDGMDRPCDIPGNPMMLGIAPTVAPVEHAEESVGDPLDLRGNSGRRRHRRRASCTWGRNVSYDTPVDLEVPLLVQARRAAPVHRSSVASLGHSLFFASGL